MRPFILALLAAAAGSCASIVFAQIQIEQRAVIRVRPVAVPPPSAPVARIRWDEKKGPNCVPLTALAGAIVSSPDSIDLLLRGGLRVRAKLTKSCPSIDFYQGFYVKPTKDGQICRNRDLIHARTGGECEIGNFHSLVPAK
jgi:hypothetical protein